jgi:isocitrate dehydrogenase (NAD+)
MNYRGSAAGLRVGFLPGDGIGPEVAWAARRCLDATGAGLAWTDVPTRTTAGARLSMRAEAILAACPAVLAGPYAGDAARKDGGVQARLWSLFGVFASVRRCRALGNPAAVVRDLDLLVIIPAEPGETSRLEVDTAHEAWPALRDSLPAGTTCAAVWAVAPDRARRFFEFAFAHAAAAGRRRVTVVHRASTYRRTATVWLKAAEAAARAHPLIETEDQLADYVALQLARAPHRFDVIAATPPDGSVLADLCVGLAGGLGMVPVVHHGVRGAIYTSVHGAAPKYTGLNRANPCAMILAGAELLRGAGSVRAAEAVEEGVRHALEGRACPADVSPGDGAAPVLTTEVTAAVIDRIRRGRLAEVRRR